MADMGFRRRLAATTGKKPVNAASQLDLKIGSFTENGIDVKVGFKNPLEISRNGAPQKMKIKFKPNVFFSKKTMKAIEPNFKLEVEVPKQYPSKDDATFMNVLTMIVRFLLYANIAVCFVVHVILPMTVCKDGSDDESRIMNAYSRREIRKSGFLHSFWPMFNAT